MKSKQEIREKKKQIAEKLSIRQVGRTPEKVKKGPTGELELFKKIAKQRCYGDYVLASHIFSDGTAGFKVIKLEDLTPTNFSHTIPKSRGEEYRLDPNNIVIVSRAYHHWEHTKQVEKQHFLN